MKRVVGAKKGEEKESVHAMPLSGHFFLKEPCECCNLSPSLI